MSRCSWLLSDCRLQLSLVVVYMVRSWSGVSFSSQLLGVVGRQLFLSVVTLVFPHFRVSSKVALL
jgi:hypothetical protein